MTIDPQGVTFLGSPPLWDFTVPVATSPFTQGGSVVAPSRRVQSPMRQRPETVDLRMRKSIRTVLVWGDGLHLTRRSQSMQRFHAEIFTTFEPWERFWKKIWRCIWQHLLRLGGTWTLPNWQSDRWRVKKAGMGSLASGFYGSSSNIITCAVAETPDMFL